jgi:hypothetical protein
MTGTLVPGPNNGVRYLGFSNPVLNQTGQTVFSAVLGGPGVDLTNDTGIFSEGSGQLKEIAREGDVAPGTNPDTQYDHLVSSVFQPTYSITNTGHTVYSASLRGPGTNGTNKRSIWLERDGSASIVVRTGEDVAGMNPGVIFTSIGVNSVNENGQILVYGTLNGPGISVDDPDNTRGLWVSDFQGDLSYLIRVGDLVPEIGPQIYIDGTSFALDKQTFNDVGQIAFRAGLSFRASPYIYFPTNESIWAGLPGSLQVVAKTGDAAPGIATGPTFAKFYDPVISNTGQVIFAANLEGPDITDANMGSVWRFDGESLGMILRNGDPAPDTPNGTSFVRIGQPTINDRGQIALLAGTDEATGTGEPRMGIWTDAGGYFSWVAQTDDPAPGTETGVTFKYFTSLSSPTGTDQVFLNNAGWLLFKCGLNGPNVNTTNDTGIWAYGPGGKLTLVIREGILFDVDNDPLAEDLRTVTDFKIAVGANGKAGLGKVFNDAGQLALKLTFADGSSGIFVATIPEPGTLGLLGVGAGLVAGRRGKRVA